MAHAPANNILNSPINPRPPTLSTLPYDLLHTILTHLPTASSLAALSATCKSLHTFIATSEHGWQIFVQSRFPSIYPTLPPAFWPATAKALTTISTSYTRRRFTARLLDPHLRPTHQTHGYHPILSCLTPSADTTLLALGAGPDLLIRKTGRKETWTLYKDRRSYTPGKDDITGLQLLTPETALVARANGIAQTVRLGAAGKASVVRRFDTAGRPVRSLAVDSTSRRFAAVLGTDEAALYDLDGDVLDSLTVPEGQQIWTTHFLGSSLALGKSGPDPLAIHELTPSGITVEPTRTFSADECAEMTTSSVFAVAALPGSAGNLLFAGWYNGATHLHDLRAPTPFVQTYSDPLDAASAIYSLHPLGRERLLVGGARHNLLKIFDLRMSGGRVYSIPPSEPEGWATYLSTAHARKESPVYSIGVLGVGGSRIVAGVEGRVWELDFEKRGRGRGGSVMYEFFGRTRLWRQREGEGPAGKGPEGGRLDARWEVCDTGVRDRGRGTWVRPRGH